MTNQMHADVSVSQKKRIPKNNVLLTKSSCPVSNKTFTCTNSQSHSLTRTLRKAMDFIILFFTASFLGIGLYWFLYVLGSAEQKGKGAAHLSGGSIPDEKLQDNYNQYSSFFRRPKEIESPDKVPAFVDTFYNLVTDIYEWGWGQSFHFSPSIPGKSHRDATRIHEEMAADLLCSKPGDRVLDVGCGVGGPMRSIAAHSGASIVGITINQYQVDRARIHNKKAGLNKLCDVVCGDFLKMPFENDSFDSAYSIEATCHAPKLEEVYKEIFRVLKPGGMYVSYEWVTTELYKNEDPVHVETIQGIEKGDALPGLRSYADIAETARKVGFEVVKEKDLSKPPAKPWWSRLKMGKVAYWRNHMLVTVLAWLGIAPQGVVDVHEMLCETAVHLTKGGESGIFSPMHMILCRKPYESLRTFQFSELDESVRTIQLSDLVG